MCLRLASSSIWFCARARGQSGEQQWGADVHSWEALVSAYVLSRLSRVRLSATLWTVARQAPLSMGFSRQEHWNGLPCPPAGDLPNLGSKPLSLTLPALAGRFFTTSPTWESSFSKIQERIHLHIRHWDWFPCLATCWVGPGTISLLFLVVWVHLQDLRTFLGEKMCHTSLGGQER